jgi:hypothetical protein
LLPQEVRPQRPLKFQGDPHRDGLLAKVWNIWNDHQSNGQRLLSIPDFSSYWWKGGASALEVTESYVTFGRSDKCDVADVESKDRQRIQHYRCAGRLYGNSAYDNFGFPLIGLGGTIVLIKGTNFNVGDNVSTYNTVKFGSNLAQAFTSAANEITAFVPKGLPLGNYSVSVFTGIHTVAFGTPFVLVKPRLPASLLLRELQAHSSLLQVLTLASLIL